MSPNSLAQNRPLLVGGTIAILAIVAYAVFAALPYLLGPTVTVLTPEDESSASTPTILISGKTERVSYLLVNDEPTPLLEDGTFAIERSYPPGYTVLVVRAKDRFGREEVETIHFLNTYNPHGTKKEIE